MFPIKIPYAQIRGGSSKGVYFKASDLPSDEVERDRYILAAMEGMGRGDLRQIDGLGGAEPLTSKVAVVSLSEDPKADLDYLFLQVVIGKGALTTAQGCGNILSGVMPFAIESGMITADDPVTTKTVRMLNGGGYCEITLQSPGKEVAIHGDARVDGVPGTAAPILCNYLETAGMNTGGLFPTGNLIDTVDGVQVTCVDNGLPVVCLKATDLGITGYESKAELDANEVLKSKLESIRLKVGPLMNLGDVSEKTVPKMCLISESKEDSSINTRTFIPKVCHAAIGVMGAFSSAICAITQGTVADGLSKVPSDLLKITIDHPSGTFPMTLSITGEGLSTQVLKSGSIRTARIISVGEVYLPLS